MIGNKKTVIILIVILIIIAAALYWRSLSASAGNVNKEVGFIITKGESVRQISENLRSAGLIKSDFYFRYYVWLSGNQADFKAGEYILNPASSVKEIVGAFAGGKTANREKEIKILEGWDINDIGNYLSKNNISGFTSLARGKIGDWSFQFAKPQVLDGAPSSADLEGFLFPDTYRVFNDAKAEDVIEKMVSNFDKKLSGDLRQEIAAQGKNVYETVIMASIIEKEVRTPEDMKIVSGIFWDRIKYGQPLESCATLAYILGEDKKQYTIKDTKIDSPYNTYRNSGLPPGPICNPGLNAIKAAIYPEHTEYNYFLNRFDTGETVFSKTYDEHLKNKAKYLK